MLIKNVAAALPGEDDFRLADILVENGRFAKIAAPGAFTDRAGLPGPKGDDILDAEGLMMFPGAIDPHVHFDEPGFTHREDFAHGTQEAARGGVTTVIDMPCTSLPPVTTIAALENKLSIVAPKAYVDFAFYGGISGQLTQAEIESAVETLSPKVVGFKCYTVSGMETFTAVNQQQFARAIALCAAAGRPLLLHAEDPEVIRQSTEALTAARGKSAAVWRDYYASRPEKAEVEACMAALRLAGKSAPWLHIVHVGTADAAKIAASGGASCETCAHYLAFDEEDFATQGASLKTAPPVKDPSQKALLWRLLADGTISYVTSDHAGAPDY
ncbi:MAG: amidohydrolase family protein, partial [Spirochaetaceae bacterium]|nr:amidohydrolase family protein [Spirochaetaceae bacterium]